MPRAGAYETRAGALTTRSGSFAQVGRLAEMIEDFEDGYRSDVWHQPTWSGSARHNTDADVSTTRTGDGSLHLTGYFEDWALADDLDTPAVIGRPIRCWFRPDNWRARDGTGSQYWFTLGHPEEDSRQQRLELNTIHTGTARIRWRNGSAKTLDSLDGGTAHRSDGHQATEGVWFAWDVYSPGCRAIQSSQFDEGETLPPGEWQFALHEDGEQDNPTVFDVDFAEYQSWPGDEMKIGVWAGLSGDEVIFDDIQLLAEDFVESDPGTDPETDVIDDFESYDAGQLPVNWTTDGSGSVDVDASAALHDDSEQGVHQEGSSQLRSFPGQGLDRYPEDGVELSILMELDSRSRQPWVLINLEDDDWSTETESWRFEIHPDSGIRIVYDDHGDRDVRDSDSDYSFSTGETYDLRFVLDSSEGIEFRVLDSGESEVASASTSDTERIDDEMSIGLRSGRSVRWDYARLLEDAEE